MTVWDEQAEIEKRSVPARIGLAALNLVLPGLGLARLNRLTSATAFIVAEWFWLLLMWLHFKYGPVVTFDSWTRTLVIAAFGVTALYGGSIVLTWRASAVDLPRTGWIWRWYGLLLIWVIVSAVAFPINNLRGFYRNFSIKAGSMLPVLQVNDVLLAQMRPATPLVRGDLVIVSKGAVSYVKRIVAIPGDTVSMIAGQIVIDGKTIAQRKLSSTLVSDETGSRPAVVYAEQLPGEANPHQIMDEGNTPQDNWSGATLGTNQYVVLGDNRDNSLDSRIPVALGGFGVVTHDQIIGRALFRFWRSGKGYGNGPL